MRGGVGTEIPGITKALAPGDEVVGAAGVGSGTAGSGAGVKSSISIDTARGAEDGGGADALGV